MREVLLVGLSMLAATVARAADCPACAFDCPEGTTNCWSCGTRVPGSRKPDELAPVNLIVLSVLPAKKTEERAGAASDPSADVEAVESWIDEHAGDHAGAIERLESLLDDVRGTVYEKRIEEHIADVRAAVEEASKPMTEKEREAKAARMLLAVQKQISSNPDGPRENIREIEKLLAVAKGTNYEGIVRRLLKAEKAKLKR